MKPIRLFLLSLALMVLLAACGGEEISPETASPAPEPIPAEEIQEDPFSAYLDLSGLSPEFLAGALQTIDQESTLNDVTVQVRQTLGDSRSLYVLFDVIYPGEADPAAYFTVTLAKGAVSDPSQAEELPGRVNGSLDGTQTQENTMSYLAEFDFQASCLTGQEISLLIQSSDLDCTYVFTWTAENEEAIAQADLVDQTGRTVGNAVFSPFLLTLELPEMNHNDYEQWATFAETLQLLDADSNALPTPIGWQADSGAFYAQFYAPMETSTVQAIQAGDYTGTFQ